MLFRSRDNAIQRESVPLDSLRLARLRRAIEVRLAVIPMEPESLDVKGRHNFLAANGGLGVFYGIMVPRSLHLRKPLPAIGAFVVTAGTTFIVPWLASTNHAITGSMASLSYYGATRGAVHGFLVSDPFSRKPATPEIGRAHV